MDNRKRSKYNKMIDQITKVSKDPDVRAAARDRDNSKKKGRLAFQSDMTERESQTMLVRVVSPKMK